MSNIDELPDLAGDVRDRAVPPPYEQVTRRVRAHRLRTATGTMAAVVITVGGIAVWQNVATTASPSPAPPITQPADPAYPASPAWRQVVDGTDSHPFEIQGTDDGSIAVVWRALEHPEPTFALVIREADGTVHGRRLDSPVSLTPVPGGWVGLRTERAWFIAADGTWTDLGSPGPSRQPQRGDVFVDGQFGQLALLPTGPHLVDAPDAVRRPRRWASHSERRPDHLRSRTTRARCASPCGEQQQGPDLPGGHLRDRRQRVSPSLVVGPRRRSQTATSRWTSGLWSRDAGNSWQDPGLTRDVVDQRAGRAGRRQLGGLLDRRRLAWRPLPGRRLGPRGRPARRSPPASDFCYLAFGDAPRPG